MARKPKREIARCFNCRKVVGEDDYCHGCNVYVCDQCDARGANGAAGPHLPEQHLSAS